MVAVLILVLVLAVFFAFILFGAVILIGTGGESKVRNTMATLVVIKGQARSYQLVHSACPPTLNALVSQKYLEPSLLIDGWGWPLNYSVNPPGSAQPFTLFSSGPDGAPLTPDDIPVPWP